MSKAYPSSRSILKVPLEKRSKKVSGDTSSISQGGLGKNSGFLRGKVRGLDDLGGKRESPINKDKRDEEEPIQ